MSLLTMNTSLSPLRHAGDRVFPSMFVEGITELAFDDVLPEDPDFPAIQGLAEAGLVSSKLSRKDIGCEINPIQPGCSGDTSTFFHPDSPLTRQDLISWKVSLEHHKLAPTSVDDLKKVSNFIDIKRIDKDALPAVAYDLSLGEKSLITATFGFTRRFEPMKPVTRAQVACTLALGESAELVGEELERINYERMAEEAVQAADEAEAEEARAEQEAVDAAKRDLAVERQRREDAEKAVEAVRQELRMAEEQRQEEKESIIKTKGVVETERGLLEDLKRSTEEQMALLSSSKQGLQAEKKLLQELRAMAEAEREATIRVKAEMAAEKEALLTARARAEDESRKAMDEAKKLQAVRRELGANSESLPGTLEKLSAGEVRPLPKWPNVPSDEPESATEGQAGPLFNAENLLNRGKELRTRAGAAVEGAVATTTEMVSSAVKGVGEVTGGAQEKAGHAASAVADGVKKAAQDVKEEAVKFAQWLKLS